MVPLSPVYRKHTHTDQYLHWHSHHSITHKYSIYNTLSNRAQYVCSNHSYLNKKPNISKQLSACATTLTGFSTGSNPKQTSNSVKKKTKQHNNTNPHSNTNKNHNSFIVVPYSKDPIDSFRNICGKAGVQVHFKCANTVNKLLVAPKDKESIIQKGEVI